jgi:uncharacterized ion transporter superfamily protein YfcC
MSDNSAKVLSVTAVWISTACLFIFGICKMNWHGNSAIMMMLLVSVVICIAAAYATKKICDVFTPVTEIEDV